MYRTLWGDPGSVLAQPNLRKGNSKELSEAAGQDFELVLRPCPFPMNTEVKMWFVGAGLPYSSSSGTGLLRTACRVSSAFSPVPRSGSVLGTTLFTH